ncbi:phosphoesterase PA-phosphatase-like protein [Salinarchaeum sp. Harcht-Bsk1]|uniref:phosphatase PAP2 family protein n=1 Tax=Salinarchaeum sp. Harcht-Bsk1 TaxID=1333523 RepID=UPI00034239DF|nr:phosphatase PAP2 family protein [Salinarchaeum sp. Harcht-Bsk1]AGN01386.1 phosphoesterase PA-phosphatase-like protein [Salinarchaeum sp. Harcht-Bsk1]
MPVVPWEVIGYTLGPTIAVVVVFAVLTGWHRHAKTAMAGDLRGRAIELSPYAGVLVLVLLLNAFVRPRVDEFSSAFAIAFTDNIQGFEGNFVALLQDAIPEPMFLYFSAVYVVGYGALLLYPPIAYVVIDDLLKPAMLFVAYAVNYFTGALLYVVFAVYGPRNLQVGRVEAPLFEEFPDIMYLTSAINTNSNAFPSLHTSMAVTVLIFAWFTREEYPIWTVIASILAPSVVLATMALGIHWFTDVIAGVALAVFSVGAAQWIVPRVRGEVDDDRRPLDPVRL